MLYCRKRNYTKTAFEIDQAADLSKFSRFLNIERFVQTTSPTNQVLATIDNEKRIAHSKTLKIRARKKPKENAEDLPKGLETKPEESLRLEAKGDTFYSVGKMQKILKSKNCTIGKLIQP